MGVHRLFIQYRRTAAGMEGMGGVQKHSEAPGMEHRLLVLEMGITAGGVVASQALRERMSSIKRGIVHMFILLLRDSGSLLAFPLQCVTD